jgi:arsenate reductase (thioredoxin)
MNQQNVLFVCVHNAGRSQFAAGLAAQHPELQASSAGTEPDDKVDDVMLASLGEIGIDRSDQVPRKLTPEMLEQADVVIALKPNLPLPAGIRHEVWELPEPEAWDLEGVRPLREHLNARVQDLVDELQAVQHRG